MTQSKKSSALKCPRSYTSPHLRHNLESCSHKNNFSPVLPSATRSTKWKSPLSFMTTSLQQFSLSITRSALPIQLILHHLVILTISKKRLQNMKLLIMYFSTLLPQFFSLRSNTLFGLLMALVTLKQVIILWTYNLYFASGESFWCWLCIFIMRTINTCLEHRFSDKAPDMQIGIFADTDL